MSSERLLVLMRIGQAAGDVEPAVDAVLLQEVPLSLLLIDDRPANDTPFPEFSDPRVRVLRNGRTLGVSQCLRIALAESDAPLVAEVPPRGMALPDSLRRLAEACESSAAIGIAHSWFFRADVEGRIERQAHRRQREYFQTRLARSDDVRRELLLRGDVLSPLRVFRREALAGWNGSATMDERASTLGLLAWIADHFAIETVPDYLFWDRESSPLRKSRLHRARDAARQSLGARKAIGRTVSSRAMDTRSVGSS